MKISIKNVTSSSQPNNKKIVIEFSEGYTVLSLERFFSNGIFAGHFKKLIDARNSNDYLTLTIDRQKGLDYRNGINNFVSNSMIAQFSKLYLKNPNSFRNKTTPFKITYSNERGIDAGGLMRDFFTELVCDIKTPRVGFFIQTPNGRNHEGKFQDCLVPAAAPEISNSEGYYQAIGAYLRSQFLHFSSVPLSFLWRNGGKYLWEKVFKSVYIF